MVLTWVGEELGCGICFVAVHDAGLLYLEEVRLIYASEANVFENIEVGLFCPVYVVWCKFGTFETNILLSSCLSEEFIQTPFFPLKLLFYLLYFKKKKQIPLDLRPTTWACMLGLRMSCRLDACPAFSCLSSGVASDDNTGQTSRALAPLRLFTSFRFHLVLLTAAWTPSANVRIEQFFVWRKGKLWVEVHPGNVMLAAWKGNMEGGVCYYTFMHSVDLLSGHIYSCELCADSFLFSLNTNWRKATGRGSTTGWVLVTLCLYIVRPPPTVVQLGSVCFACVCSM